MNNEEEKYIYFLTIFSALIGTYALILGIENFEENRKQNASQEKLIRYLEKHLKKQDEHLYAQDDLLKGEN